MHKRTRSGCPTGRPDVVGVAITLFLVTSSMIGRAVLAAEGPPTVLYVDDDADPGGDGLAWSTAFTHLRDAISLAMTLPGRREIRVAGGRYTPIQIDRFDPKSDQIHFAFSVRPGIALMGGYLGLAAGVGEDPDTRDPARYVSTLSGDLLGDDGSGFANRADNSISVLRGFPDDDSCLDGFVISGAGRGGGLYLNGIEDGAEIGLVVRHCVFTGNVTNALGGGAYFRSTRAIITDCEFVDNRVGVTEPLPDNDGGGLAGLESTLVIERCTFRNNVARNGGGGVSLVMTPALVVECVFEGNAVTGPSVGGTGGGGGMVAYGSVTVVGCTFEGNTVAGAQLQRGVGGGYIAAGAPIGEPGAQRLVNCLFRGNDAMTRAGGLWVQTTDVELLNCIVDDNTAASGGAATMYGPASLTLKNCSVKDNLATSAVGGIDVDLDDSTALTIVNTVLWGNTAPKGTPLEQQLELEALSSLSVDYSCVQGWNEDADPGAIGMIGRDPMFADADGRLSVASPCIDAGWNWALPADALDLDGDANVEELTPVDADGQPRVTTGRPSTAAPFCGPRADMGAFEARGAPADDLIFGDVDGDGIVAVTDLLLVLGAWGNIDICPLSDLDGDGDVTLFDLLILLDEWS